MFLSESEALVENYAKRQRFEILSIPQMKIIRCSDSHSTLFQVVIDENNFICGTEFWVTISEVCLNP